MLIVREGFHKDSALMHFSRCPQSMVNVCKVFFFLEIKDGKGDWAGVPANASVTSRAGGHSNANIT